MLKKNVIQALVFSKIDYGLPILCNMSKETCGVLQKAQNAAVRFIAGIRLSDREHITKFYAEYGWLKIVERLELTLVLNMWKAIKFKEPIYIYEMLSFNVKKDRSTRSHCNRLLIPKHRTEYYSNSILVKSIRAWNIFNVYDYLSYKTLIKLKKDIKNKLLDRYSC